MHRRFILERVEDLTGVSGEGIVAEGIRFTDGQVVIRWCGVHASTVVHESINSVIAIHGHEGQTRVIFLDGHPQ